MSRLAPPQRRRTERESTIPLINVVFLLLVFFIVAGTLSTPRDGAVQPAEAEAFEAARLDPRMIYVDSAGALRVGGTPMSAAEAIVAAGDGAPPGERITVVPDRRLDAAEMIAILAELGALTERPLAILTERPGRG